MSPSYPSALERLSSPESFDPRAIANIPARHLRELLGSDVGEGMPVDREAVIEHHVRWYVDRILEGWDVLTIADGEPGVGKSMGLLYLISRVRDLLGRETGTTRMLDLRRDVVWRPDTLIQRINDSSREDPSTILCDEGVLAGMHSGAGLTPEGRALDKVFSVSRIQGCSIWVVAPSIWGLSSMIRQRRARAWLHFESRGVATIFQLKTAIEFRPPKNLPFLKTLAPWHRLHFPDLRGTPMWGEYEEIKLGMVKEALVDAKMVVGKALIKAGMRPSSADQMDYLKVRGGRAEGETPAEYHRRTNRQRMADKRRTQRRVGPASPSPRKVGVSLPV